METGEIMAELLRREPQLRGSYTSVEVVAPLAYFTLSTLELPAPGGVQMHTTRGHIALLKAAKLRLGASGFTLRVPQMGSSR